MIHDDPMLRSYGRGLVSDDLILWPTQTDLFLLSPETGLPVRPPIRKPHGNLAFADGLRRRRADRRDADGSVGLRLRPR
jgi:hypothetical protein